MTMDLYYPFPFVRVCLNTFTGCRSFRRCLIVCFQPSHLLFTSLTYFLLLLRIVLVT